MILLQNDMKELFATATMGTTPSEDSLEARWSCSFLTQAPIILCDFTFDELLEDELLSLLLAHEYVHYEEMFVVLPILLHNWMTLFSFIDFQKYLIRKKEESQELVIRFGEVPGLYTFEHAPLLNGFFVRFPRKGQVGYDLAVPLEGLALYRSMAGFPLPVLQRFGQQAFGSLEMRERINALHHFAFVRFLETFEKLEGIVDQKNFFRAILSTMNLWPHVITRRGIVDMLKVFGVSPKLDDGYHDYSAQIATLRNLAHNSVLAFQSIRRNPEQVEKVIKFDKVSYKALLTSLFHPALAKVKATFLEYPSFITSTSYKVANTLFTSFIYNLAGYFDRDSIWPKLSTVAEKHLREQGVISPLCADKDGGMIALSPHKIGYPLGKYKRKEAELSLSKGARIRTWLDFLTIKAVIHWFQTLEPWVCPLYRFFSQRIGGIKGRKFQRNFCGRACSPLQSRRNSDVLDVENLDKDPRGNRDCLFWSSVKEIFSDFRTIRIERSVPFQGARSRKLYRSKTDFVNGSR